MASLARKRKSNTLARDSVGEFDVGNPHGSVALVFDSDMDPDAGSGGGGGSGSTGVVVVVDDDDEMDGREDRVVRSNEDSHVGQQREHGVNDEDDGGEGEAFDEDGDDDGVPETSMAKRSRQDRAGISDGRQLHELAIGAYEAAQEKEWVRRHAHAHAQHSADADDDVDEHENNAVVGNGDDDVDGIDDDDNGGANSVLTSGSVHSSQRSRQGKGKHHVGSRANSRGAPLPLPHVSGMDALVGTSGLVCLLRTPELDLFLRVFTSLWQLIVGRQRGSNFSCVYR